MFSFYFSIFYLLCKLLLGYELSVATQSAAKFLFYWNGFFVGLTLTFFLSLLLGISAVLIRVPFLGIGIFQLQESIRKTGIWRFLAEKSIFWILVHAFVLVGAYFLAFDPNLSLELRLSSISLIIIGYLLKKIRQKKSTPHKKNPSIVFPSQSNHEKEINPQ